MLLPCNGTLDVHVSYNSPQGQIPVIGGLFRTSGVITSSGIQDRYNLRVVIRASSSQGQFTALKDKG